MDGMEVRETGRACGRIASPRTHDALNSPGRLGLVLAGRGEAVLGLDAVGLCSEGGGK